MGETGAGSLWHDRSMRRSAAAISAGLHGSRVSVAFMSGRATGAVAGHQSADESIRHLRLERDRHVAFAFAAADLLIEVSTEGTIIAAAGAAQAILGVVGRGLVGKSILD